MQCPISHKDIHGIEQKEADWLLFPYCSYHFAERVANRHNWIAIDGVGHQTAQYIMEYAEEWSVPFPIIYYPLMRFDGKGTYSERQQEGFNRMQKDGWEKTFTADAIVINSPIYNLLGFMAMEEQMRKRLGFRFFWRPKVWIHVGQTTGVDLLDNIMSYSERLQHATRLLIVDSIFRGKPTPEAVEEYRRRKAKNLLNSALRLYRQ